MIESQIEAKNFIGGEWVPPKSGKSEAERAIGAAAEAAPGWKATLPAERGAILSKAADLLESQVDELAELMAREVGKPMVESRAEVARAAAIFRYYGSEGWRLDGIMPPSARPGIHISSA